MVCVRTCSFEYSTKSEKRQEKIQKREESYSTSKAILNLSPNQDAQRRQQPNAVFRLELVKNLRVMMSELKGYFSWQQCVTKRGLRPFAIENLR